MSDIKIDINTQDLVYTDNDLTFTEDSQESIGQDIATYLRTCKGEWFRDVTMGLDYFNEILKNGIDPGIIASRIKQAILSREGVLSVQGVNVVFDSATSLLTVTVEKIFVKDGSFPYTVEL